MNDVELEKWLDDRMKYEIVRSAVRQGSPRRRLNQREEKLIRDDYLSIYDCLDEKYKPKQAAKLDSEEDAFLCAVELFRERPWLFDIM